MVSPEHLDRIRREMHGGGYEDALNLVRRNGDLIRARPDHEPISLSFQVRAEGVDHQLHRFRRSGHASPRCAAGQDIVTSSSTTTQPISGAKVEPNVASILSIRVHGDYS